MAVQNLAPMRAIVAPTKSPKSSKSSRSEVPAKRRQSKRISNREVVVDIQIIKGPTTKDTLHKVQKAGIRKEKKKTSSIRVQANTKVPRVKKVSAPVYRSLRVIEKGIYALQPNSLPDFLHDQEVIIRNHATGLNPIDWKTVDYNFCMPSFPWINGREMAGTVHAVAPGVTTCKVGDKVWTSTYYRDHRAGCFQDLVTVPQHTVLAIPKNIAVEEAAILGVAALTAAMTLWKWLQVPRDVRACMSPLLDSRGQREVLLVWGGSTCTGQFAIQIAVRSGLEVIAVTSGKTCDMVKKLGAHTVVVRDGKTNSQIVDEIQKIGGNRISRGLDLVGNDTAPFTIQALSKTKPSIFAPLAFMKAQEVPSNIEVVTVEMKHFVNEPSSRVYAEDLNFLAAGGALKFPELHVLGGGLEAIEEGLDRLKKGDMGGKKLVVSWSS